MYTYRKFSVEKNDHFESQKYPEINEALQAIVLQLGSASATPGSTMLLSFVKDHCISSKSVEDYPALSNMISSKELPLNALEDLFEASKSNPAFRNELESHIATYLNNASPLSSSTKPVL